MTWEVKLKTRCPAAAGRAGVTPPWGFGFTAVLGYRLDQGSMGMASFGEQREECAEAKTDDKVSHGLH